LTRAEPVAMWSATL